MRLYEALVIPIMTYNAGTWATTKAVFEKIDIAHRKHVRQIMGIRWSDKISNETLYKKAQVTKLSERISKARWKMLGRVLRQNEQNPAYTSLMFAVKSEKHMKGRRGRPRINLFSEILKDLQAANINLENCEDCLVAKDEKVWENIFENKKLVSNT